MQAKGAVVQLEPDVAAFFPDASAANEGLRLLIRLLQKAQPSAAMPIDSVKNA